MASNIWQDEIVRCCNAIDRETTRSLNTIQAHYSQSGRLVNHDFKINFLKMVNYRLMETYKRFEIMFSMEKDLGKSTVCKDDDINMSETTNDSPFLEQHVNAYNIGSTPFLVKNTPANVVDDILNDTLPPLSHRQSQENIFQPKKKLVSEDVKTNTNREWVCFPCKEEKPRDISKIVFSTIDKLYDHWYSQHAPDNVPFRFYPADLLSCSIGTCRYFSTYHGLKRHHIKQHSNEIFVAVQNRQCALCLYRDHDLKFHICKNVDKVDQLKIFNPILYTEDVLAELQEFNRKFECKLCNSLFDSSQEIMSHHHDQHGQQSIEMGKAEIKQIVTMICGCCQLTISAAKHVEHLKYIVRKRWSHMNTWNDWYHQFEMDYLRTRVVFGNGLVLYKQNLIATDLGGYPGYEKLGRDLFNSLKKNNNSN